MIEKIKEYFERKKQERKERDKRQKIREIQRYEERIEKIGEITARSCPRCGNKTYNNGSQCISCNTLDAAGSMIGFG